MNLGGSSKIVHSLWIGPELSALENSCFKSWSEQGYEHWLWCYDTPTNVPNSTVVKPAEAILPASSVFRYQAGNFGLGSFSGFSNFFRYKALLEHGGVWADADMYCLKPLPHHDNLFLREQEKVATCLFAVQPGSPVMAECWDRCSRLDTSKLQWAQSGPMLLVDVLRKQNLLGNLRPEREFLPVMWQDVARLMCPPVIPLKNCYGVHFWHQQMHESGYDKSKHYPGSTFERLVHNEV